MKFKYLLSFILSLIFIISVNKVSADEACSPNSCTGSGTTSIVTSCVASSGYNCLNAPGSYSSTDYNCKKGGGPGSCVAKVQDVKTCGTITQGKEWDCNCTDPTGSCGSGSNSGDSCGSGGSCSCGWVPDGQCNGSRASTLGCCNGPGAPQPGECNAACSNSTECSSGLSCIDGACTGDDCTASGGVSCDKNCNGDADCGSGWICAPQTKKCWSNACGGSAYGCKYQTVTNDITGATYQQDFSACLPLTTTFTQKIKPNHSSYVDKTHFDLEAMNNDVIMWNADYRFDPEVFSHTTILKNNIPIGQTGRLRARVKNYGANATDNCNSIHVTNSCPNRDSECVSSGIPTEIVAGETVAVSLKFKNTGLETWTPTWTTGSDYPFIPGRIRLGSQDPMDNQVWGKNRVYMPGANVPIGSSYTISFDITAPALPGRYSSKWQLLKEHVQWFGEYCGPNLVTVTPDCPSNFTLTPTGSDTVLAEWDSAPAGVNNYIIRVDNDWENNQCLNSNNVPIPWFCGAQGDQWLEEPDKNINSGTEANSRIITNVDRSKEYFISVQSVAPDAKGGTRIPGCRLSNILPACEISCTEDCGTGITLDEIPGPIASAPSVDGLSSGKKYLTTNPQVTINWSQAAISSPATVNGYDIWIFPQTSTAPENGATTCIGCEKLSELNGVSDTSITYTPSKPQTNKVSIYVRAKNTSCTTTRYGNWSPVRNVDYIARVSGTIYESDVKQSGGFNNCSGDGGGSRININTSTGNPIISHNYGTSTTAPGVNNFGLGTTLPGYNYVLGDIPYNPDGTWYSNLEIELNLNDYTDPENRFFCNCPQDGDLLDCNHTDTTAPASGENFFVSKIDLSNGPWWQTKSGNVYGYTGYTNPIPRTCENDDTSPYCDPNIVSLNSFGDLKSAGLPISGGIINSNGYYTEYDGVVNPHANYTEHENLIKEDYDYYIKNLNLNTLKTIANKISEIPTSGSIYQDAEIFYSPTNLTIEFDSTILNVPSGDKKIIFVNGDVTITNIGSLNRHLLSVDKDGYFGIIASGDIIIDDSVGNSCSFPTCDSEITNIDGVYVASKQLIIKDDGNPDEPDNMFVGAGTFVGWQGVQQNRSFDNNGVGNQLDRALNNEYPTAQFIFRPDFNKNTPQFLLHPNLVWQEVN